ncbi:MAG: hypothetical protein RJA76_163 [Bacteroidota bacterium]|jgi:L-threonylcarbamoyladenylate synthase
MITRDINLIIDQLKNGNAVGLPTETVYGLAANAFDVNAIQKIYELKKRPSSNPLIVHIGRKEQLQQLVEKIPTKLERLMDQFWPGPLTVLLPKVEAIPNEVTSGSARVAVRMPNHPLTLDLLNRLPFPLVAPSANLYNRISPTCAQHVEKYFPETYTLDGGACQAGVESTIIAEESNEILVYRWGAIGREDIESITGKVVDKTTSTQKSIAPGMSLKHYSPLCALVVSKEPGFLLSISPEKRIGVIWFNRVKWDGPNVTSFEVLSAQSDLQEAARNLYQAMHRLEEQSVDLIIVERLPEYGLGISMNDRLDRASTK